MGVLTAPLELDLELEEVENLALASVDVAFAVHRVNLGNLNKVLSIFNDLGTLEELWHALLRPRHAVLFSPAM